MTSPGSRRAAGLALALALTLGGAAACSSAQAAQPTSVSAHHLSTRDIGWLNAAHQANEAEIQAGQYAESNTSTAAIQSVGAMMVRDHSALDAKLIQLASKLHFGLVQYLTNQQVETGDQLSNELGSTFDSDFVGMMMTAHEQMIAATEAEIRLGSSPQVVALAQQALPVLEKHLKMLRAAASSA
jgi:putative membrane protein